MSLTEKQVTLVTQQLRDSLDLSGDFNMYWISEWLYWYDIWSANPSGHRDPRYNEALSRVTDEIGRDRLTEVLDAAEKLKKEHGDGYRSILQMIKEVSLNGQKTR